MQKRAKRFIKLAALTFWIAIFSLYTVTPTFAKDSANREPPRSQKSVESMTNVGQTLAQTRKRHRANPRIVEIRFISHDGKPLSKALTAELRDKVNKALTEAMNTCAPGTGWDCFTECLSDLGASAWSITLCTVACFTGNAIVCAVCLGLAVASVEFCGVGCAFYAN